MYDFGKNLYQAQKTVWGEYKYTLAECVQWEYDLFIVNSLKGHTMEQQAITELDLWLPNNYIIIKSDEMIDEDFRVDLEIIYDNHTIIGIQVKPLSYKYSRENVKKYNIELNNKYDYDVLYLYYDEDSEFTNITEIINKI